MWPFQDTKTDGTGSLVASEPLPSRQPSTGDTTSLGLNPVGPLPHCERLRKSLYLLGLSFLVCTMGV